MEADILCFNMFFAFKFQKESDLIDMNQNSQDHVYR